MTGARPISLIRHHSGHRAPVAAHTSSAQKPSVGQPGRARSLSGVSSAKGLTPVPRDGASVAIPHLPSASPTTSPRAVSIPARASMKLNCLIRRAGKDSCLSSRRIFGRAVAPWSERIAAGEAGSVTASGELPTREQSAREGRHNAQTHMPELREDSSGLELLR